MPAPANYSPQCSWGAGGSLPGPRRERPCSPHSGALQLLPSSCACCRAQECTQNPPPARPQVEPREGAAPLSSPLPRPTLPCPLIPYRPPQAFPPGAREWRALVQKPIKFQKAKTNTLAVENSILCAEIDRRYYHISEQFSVSRSVSSVAGGGKHLCQLFDEFPRKPPNAQSCLGAAGFSTRSHVRLP